jgi:hypothetical protein
MASFDKQALHQRWMHSREEDTDTEVVFRPAHYDFPPARGRTGFELKQGGNLVEIGIAPTDAQQQSEGSWKLKDHNQLELYSGSDTEPYKQLQVVSAEEDRLVIKK